MARATFPRRLEAHELAADAVLRRHETATGTGIEFPVPVELIIESTFGLAIDYGVIPEPPDVVILGALNPSRKTIVLNETHNESLFERWVGPERFTLAHELGHWVYDADMPGQQALDVSAGRGEEQFCYHREGSALTEDLRVREVNANGFASCLLMPKHLLKTVDIDSVIDDFGGTAEWMGVSKSALRYRLEKLDLVDEVDMFQIGLDF